MPHLYKLVSIHDVYLRGGEELQPARHVQVVQGPGHGLNKWVKYLSQHRKYFVLYRVAGVHPVPVAVEHEALEIGEGLSAAELVGAELVVVADNIKIFMDKLENICRT